MQHYYINYGEGGRTIQENTLIEKSALKKVVWYIFGQASWPFQPMILFYACSNLHLLQRLIWYYITLIKKSSCLSHTKNNVIDETLNNCILYSIQRVDQRTVHEQTKIQCVSLRLNRPDYSLSVDQSPVLKQTKVKCCNFRNHLNRPKSSTLKTCRPNSSSSIDQSQVLKFGVDQSPVLKQTKVQCSNSKEIDQNPVQEQTKVKPPMATFKYQPKANKMYENLSQSICSFRNCHVFAITAILKRILY